MMGRDRGMSGALVTARHTPVMRHDAGRSWILVLALLALLVNTPQTFAGGRAEKQDSTNAKDKKGQTIGNAPSQVSSSAVVQSVDIKSSRYYGALQVEVAPRSSNSGVTFNGTWIVIHEGSRYRVYPDGFELASASGSTLFADAKKQGSAVDISSSLAPNWVKDIAKSGDGTYYGGVLSSVSSDVDTLLQSIKSGSSSKIGFAWNGYGKQALQLMVMGRVGSAYYFELFDGHVIDEGFTGEADLFSSTVTDEVIQKALGGTLPTNDFDKYRLKCYSLLYYLLFSSGDDEANAKKSVFKQAIESRIRTEDGIPLKIADLATVFHAFDPTIDYVELADARAAFMGVLGKLKDAFSIGLTPVSDSSSGTVLDGSYLSFDENAFGLLYGDRTQYRRSPYLEAYLLFLEDINKPVLSSVIQEELDKWQQKNPTSNPYGYDYRAYRKVTVAEGETIATSALRYLTWGVEYTPSPASGAATNTGRGQDVFGVLKDKLETWIGESSTQNDGVFSFNYFPGVKSSSDLSLAPLSVSSGQQTISRTHIVTGTMITATPVLAARLFDASTRPLSISRIDLWTAQNVAWKTGVVSEVIGRGTNLGLLSDASRDASATILPTSDGKQVEFGYIFSVPQSVGAILVIGKGLGSAPATVHITVSGGTDSIAAADCYISRTSADQYLFKPFNGGSSPGGTVYWYYILKKAETAITRISVQLPKDISVASVEELLVFDQDPISYVTSLNKASSRTAGIMISDVFQQPKKYQGSTQPRDILYRLLTNGGITEGYDMYGEASVLPPTSGPIKPRNLRLAADEGAAVLDLLWPGDTVELWGAPPSSSAQAQYVKVRSASGAEGYVWSQNLQFSYMAALPQFAFQTSTAFQTVVIWEKKDSSASAVSQEFTIFNGESSFVDSLYLQGSGPTSLTQYVSPTTPFYEIRNTDASGNPVDPYRSVMTGSALPYSPHGLDSPRTFAYKMWEQWKAREWLKGLATAGQGQNSKLIAEQFSAANTLRAVDGAGKESYSGSYVSEMQMFGALGKRLTVDRKNFGYAEDYPSQSIPTYTGVGGATQQVKPFLPGLTGVGVQGYAVATSKSMYRPEKVGGIDSTGLLMGTLAMTSLSVAPNRQGTDVVSRLRDSYYGFVAAATGIDGSGHPAYYGDISSSSIPTESYRFSRSDIEKNTVLIPDISEVQKGDLLVNYNTNGQVEIGIVVGFTWDENSAPAYGENPEDFLSKIEVVGIRPGLRQVTLGVWGNGQNFFGGFSDTPNEFQIRRILVSNGSSAAASIPSFELVQSVAWRQSPAPAYVPAINAPRDTRNSYQETSNSADQVKYVKKYVYYREFPPTSYLNRLAKSKIFRDLPMDIINLTGWRVDTSPDTISYHRGVDIIPDQVPREDRIGTPIVAPEDGEFWILSPTQLELSGRVILVNSFGRSASDTYKGSTYGFITVLDTSHGSDRNGRVYLFCHQGDESRGEVQATKDLQTAFSQQPEHQGQVFPTDYAHRVKVKAGDWIGSLGNWGQGTGPHVHLEVYEYFPEDKELQTDTNPKYSVEFLDRVNPLSMFPSDSYVITDQARETDKLIELWMHAKLITSQDVERCFRLWSSVSLP